MGRRTLAIGLLLAFMVPVGVIAASKTKRPTRKAEDKAKPDGEDEIEGRRHPTRVTKLRQGSVLRRDKALGETVDLRGEFERRRDFEIIRHYTRIAELDVIEAVARKEKDLKLIERAENVRRKELRRFWAVMQKLRALARMRSVSGAP